MEKHYYKNYLHVIDVLTKEYGFQYCGIGDNSEECFYKKSATPERVFVHPMHCSYSMDSSTDWSSERIHDIDFRSYPEIQRSQQLAFLKLCEYLDKHTVKPPDLQTMQEKLQASLDNLEKSRLEVAEMALNPNFKLETKKMLPGIYEQIIASQSLVSFILSQLR